MPPPPVIAAASFSGEIGLYGPCLATALPSLSSWVPLLMTTLVLRSNALSRVHLGLLGAASGKRCLTSSTLLTALWKLASWARVSLRLVWKSLKRLEINFDASVRMKGFPMFLISGMAVGPLPLPLREMLQENEWAASCIYLVCLSPLNPIRCCFEMHPVCPMFSL